MSVTEQVSAGAWVWRGKKVAVWRGRVLAANAFVCLPYAMKIAAALCLSCLALHLLRIRSSTTIMIVGLVSSVVARSNPNQAGAAVVTLKLSKKAVS